mgnify:CR=1 FL=1
MKIRRISLLSFSTAVSMLIVSGCSLISSNPNGNDLAAQSCTQDVEIATSTSKIVPIGFDTRSPRDVPGDELANRIELDQLRSILSAQAAATNSYWQPLADAWSLEEALARAVLKSHENTIANEAGALIPDISYFEKFMANVNTDFAAVTKDTFCRISFVKYGIPILYEPNQK